MGSNADAYGLSLAHLQVVGVMINGLVEVAQCFLQFTGVKEGIILIILLLAEDDPAQEHLELHSNNPRPLLYGRLAVLSGWWEARTWLCATTWIVRCVGAVKRLPHNV